MVLADILDIVDIIAGKFPGKRLEQGLPYSLIYKKVS